jgi:hypothetical protein
MNPAVPGQMSATAFWIIMALLADEAESHERRADQASRRT